MEILKISNNFHSLQQGIKEFKFIKLKELKFQVTQKMKLDFTKVNTSNEVNLIVSQLGATLNYWKKVNKSLTDPMDERNYDIISALNFRKITEADYGFYRLDKRTVDSLKYMGQLYDQFIGLINDLDEYHKKAQRAYFDLVQYEREMARKLAAEEEKKIKLENIKKSKEKYYKDLVRKSTPFSFIKNEEIDCLAWPLEYEQQYAEEINKIYDIYSDESIDHSSMMGLDAELQRAESQFKKLYYEWVDEYERDYNKNLKYIQRLHKEESNKRIHRKTTHQGRAAVQNHIIKHGAKIAREQLKQFQMYKKYQLGIEDEEEVLN